MDGDLRATHFPFWFDFVRLTSAYYRDASGADAIAAPGEPRFDHDDQGNALGLLIGTGDALGTGDRVSLKPEALAETIGQEVTVLHAYQGDDGIERRAWYGKNARALVNGIARTAARHVLIGVVPGYLENKGGYVRQRGESWYLTNAIGTGASSAISDGARPLIDQ